MLFFQKKGQVALEYLILTVFLLIVIIILFGYSFIVLTENSKLQVALSSVRTLASSADQVSALGPDNSVVVQIQLPDNVASFDVNETAINIRLNQLAGQTDVTEYSLSTLTWQSLPTTSGTYNIKVEVVDANVLFSVVS